MAPPPRTVIALITESAAIRLPWIVAGADPFELTMMALSLVPSRTAVPSALVPIEFDVTRRSSAPLPASTADTPPAMRLTLTVTSSAAPAATRTPVPVAPVPAALTPMWLFWTVTFEAVEVSSGLRPALRFTPRGAVPPPAAAMTLQPSSQAGVAFPEAGPISTLLGAWFAMLPAMSMSAKVFAATVPSALTPKRLLRTSMSVAALPNIWMPTSFAAKTFPVEPTLPTSAAGPAMKSPVWFPDGVPLRVSPNQLLKRVRPSPVFEC